MNGTSTADALAQVNTVATHAAATVWTVGGDFLIVLVLLAALFLFAWYVGRGPFVALMLAFYAAYAVYTVFPYASLLPGMAAPTAVGAHILVYVALTFGFYLIMRRVIVSDFLYIGVVALIVLSFLGAGFLLALAFHGFGVTSLYTFTPAVTALFSPNGWFFWWFVAPAVGLFFLAR